MPDNSPLSQPKPAEDVMVTDDDFAYYFPSSESSRRLAEESRAHLKLIEKFIENGDVDSRQIVSTIMVLV